MVFLLSLNWTILFKKSLQKQSFIDFYNLVSILKQLEIVYAYFVSDCGYLISAQGTFLPTGISACRHHALFQIVGNTQNSFLLRRMQVNDLKQLIAVSLITKQYHEYIHLSKPSKTRRSIHQRRFCTLEKSVDFQANVENSTHQTLK